jgi:hypothetical protein
MFCSSALLNWNGTCIRSAALLPQGAIALNQSLDLGRLW